VLRSLARLPSIFNMLLARSAYLLDYCCRSRGHLLSDRVMDFVKSNGATQFPDMLLHKPTPVGFLPSLSESQCSFTGMFSDIFRNCPIEWSVNIDTVLPVTEQQNTASVNQPSIPRFLIESDTDPDEDELFHSYSPEIQTNPFKHGDDFMRVGLRLLDWVHWRIPPAFTPVDEVSDILRLIESAKFQPVFNLVKSPWMAEQLLSQALVDGEETTWGAASDASLMGSLLAAASTIFVAAHVLSTSVVIWGTGDTTAFEGEGLGILQALTQICEQLKLRAAPEKVILATDSQSWVILLRDLIQGRSQRRWSSLEKAILLCIAELSNYTVLQLVWIPGHQGIPPNEFVDRVAAQGIRAFQWASSLQSQACIRLRRATPTHKTVRGNLKTFLANRELHFLTILQKFLSESCNSLASFRISSIAVKKKLKTIKSRRVQSVFLSILGYGYFRKIVAKGIEVVPCPICEHYFPSVEHLLLCGGDTLGVSDPIGMAFESPFMALELLGEISKILVKLEYESQT